MKHYVYKISNIVEDKHYIGARSAKNPFKDLGIKYFSSSSDKEFMLEQQEFPERFEYKILEVFSSRDLAVAKEIELHDLYDVAVNESFYNRAKQTSTGFCRLGTTVTHTEESKRKMSESKLGKTISEETKKKIGLAQSGDKNHMWGKTISEETKRKIGLAHRGRVFSVETKRRMSLAQSGKNNPNFGKTTSEETKEKISISGKLAQQKRYIENARRFIIYDSDGNLIHDELIVSFVRFCADNKYPKGSFSRSYRANEPVKGGKFKGWTVRRTNQQTKGE